MRSDSFSFETPLLVRSLGVVLRRRSISSRRCTCFELFDPPDQRVVRFLQLVNLGLESLDLLVLEHLFQAPSVRIFVVSPLESVDVLDPLTEDLRFVRLRSTGGSSRTGRRSRSRGQEGSESVESSIDRLTAAALDFFLSTSIANTRCPASVPDDGMKIA